MTLARARDLIRAMDPSEQRSGLQEVERLASRLYDRTWNEELEVEFKQLAETVWGPHVVVSVSRAGIAITRKCPSAQPDVLFQMVWSAGRASGQAAARAALKVLVDEVKAGRWSGAGDIGGVDD